MLAHLKIENTNTSHVGQKWTNGGGGVLWVLLSALTFLRHLPRSQQDPVKTSPALEAHRTITCVDYRAAAVKEEFLNRALVLV